MANKQTTETTTDTSTASTQLTKGKALDQLIAYVMANNPSEQVIAAAKIARPSYFGLAERANSADGLNASYRKFYTLFGNEPKVGDTVTLDQCFAALKFGRVEMRHLCNELTLWPCEGVPVVWIQTKGEQYTIVAIEPDPNTIPEGWQGYLPKRLNNGVARLRNSKNK